MSDLAKRDVTPDWRPASTARKRPAAAKQRKTTREHSAAWYQAVVHKYDAALWTNEDYPMLVDGEAPLHERPKSFLRANLQAHHIIPRQECRKHGAPEWDIRNGVPVTKRRHERHHSRIEPITRDELPAEVFGFLSDYPRLWGYFNRMYPDTTATAPAVASERTTFR